MKAEEYEKLGAFYLGAPIDRASRASLDTPLLLASKHLVTHGVIVGMTGSGKTGLGVVLLEEAAIDGVPAIVIDPKGDLTNLLLAFPEADEASFAPWVPEGDAPRDVADRHRRGLESTGQDVARVSRLAAVERVVYTPGASFGRPLSLMPPLSPPEGADSEVLRERAVTTASALLTLVGVDADPLTSAAHTFLSSLLVHAWSRGTTLDPLSLIRAIQAPPFTMLGAMDLESVFATKARAELAARLNNALASPAMASFLEGESLSIDGLLRGPRGPRLAILSIAHLSDADRMFFVTMLLGELVAWMRKQSGTQSLRALLYMDEVFGFFPPVANPPSKTPMLTLLKQARAFGLGVVLATQNPVDLDYKGLANTGTWMLGRLQTERDKLRVLDGLEGAAQSSGHGFERADVDALLSGLEQRTFLLHSVHEPRPVLFRSRWALSYLRGPLSRDELSRLTATTRLVGDATPASRLGGPVGAPPLASSRPVLAPDVRESFLVRTDLTGPLEYRPGLFARASMRFVDAKLEIDTWLTPNIVAPLGDEGPRFDEAWFLGTGEVATQAAPSEGATFAALPPTAARPASYTKWEKDVIAHLVRDRPLVVLVAKELGLASKVGETRDLFMGRVGHRVRERRDEELELLAGKWQPKVEKARAKVEKAERDLDDAESAASSQNLTSGIEMGASVLGAVLGTRRSIGAAASRAARSAQRASKRSTDKARAREELAARQAELATLEADLRAALEAIRASWDVAHVTIEEKPIGAKKSELRIEARALMWVPIARA